MCRKVCIDVKVGRRNGYKLIDTFDIFIDKFKEDEEINDLFEMLKYSSPELFKKLEYQTTKNNNLYLFRNSIFESVENRDTFDTLKNAIKNSEYRKIKFFDDDILYEVKCIRLVVVDNNWYLAYIDSEDVLKLGRVSFLEEVKYATKNSYQKSTIKKHMQNLKNNLQNSMTLFEKTPKTATLKATANMAKYFDKDMKKFLATQKFKEKLEDGSVLFTIEYTQPLEVLPFIQKWMPDLIILEPQELRDEYMKKLETTIQNLKEENEKNDTTL